MTPLMYAARRGNVGCVEALLGVPGIDVGACDIHGDTAWHFACRGAVDAHGRLVLSYPEDADERIKVLQALSKCSGFDVSARNKNGESALMAAINSNQVFLVDALHRDQSLGFEVEFNALETPGGDDSFTFACRAGHTDLALHMLPYGEVFDPNHQDAMGRTGLILAVINNHRDLVAALMERSQTDRLTVMRIDPDIPDEQGNTAFHYVCKSDDTELIDLFLKHRILAVPAVRNLEGHLPWDLCGKQENRDRIALRAKDYQARWEALLIPPSAMDFTRPRTLTDSEFDSWIGTVSDSPAFISVLPGDLDDKHFARIFRRELLRLDDLGTHENVLGVLGYSNKASQQTNKQPFAVIGLPRGPEVMVAFSRAVHHWDLRSYIGRIRDKSDYLSIAIRLLRGVASGLDYAQQDQVLCFFDLGPRWVMVFEEGDGNPTAKLVDVKRCRGWNRTESPNHFNAGSQVGSKARQRVKLCKVS